MYGGVSMQISVSDNLIVLNGKNYILSDEIEKIAIISSTHIVDFFNKKNIKLPRKIRINALRLTFRDLVEKSRVLRSDGFSDEFLYRLNWFKTKDLLASGKLSARFFQFKFFLSTSSIVSAKVRSSLVRTLFKSFTYFSSFCCNSSSVSAVSQDSFGSP